MTEGAKALNSSVSTLKKNPGRIGRLVKAAKLLIVPPKHYATGAVKDTLDAAVRKLKGKRGLNGVSGEGAGPFSDKVMEKKAVEKKAVDKKTKDRALAGSAVLSGAALGGVLTHDHAKASVKTRHAIKENARAAKYANGSERAVGFSRRLARSARVDRNMVKPLRRAGVKGAVAGGLVGAALGAAHLKKEAAVPAVIPKQEFLGKGKIPVGAKDVSPKAVLKAKAGKAGKIAAGVVAGATLVGAAKKHLEKKAEKKDSNVVGGAIGAGSVAYSARSIKDTSRGLAGVAKQYKHLVSKGHRPTPIDFHMAMKTLEKPIARRSANAGVKGLVAGALAGAAYDRLKGHKKSAAEKIKHNGKTVRRGTVTSAATTTGTTYGVLAAIGSRKNPKKAIKEATKSFIGGGVLGGTYGVTRKGLRTARGEKSMDPRDFDKAKGNQRP